MRKMLVSALILFSAIFPAAAAVGAPPSPAEAAGPPYASDDRAPRPKAYLVVTFDVEDYISLESEGIDDIPKWLADIMSEEGVTGTFFVIGEKARSFEKRGRRDVIAAMARHDVGGHTNFGSMHPTVTEQLEKADWAGGVQKMFEQESAGLREIGRIFGLPARTLARHGGSYGPQLAAALGRMGAASQTFPASLPGHDVVWFCNALNFSAQYASGFDDTYYRDDLFAPVFDKLKADLPGAARTTEVIALFCGHPTKIRAEEFWDLNYYGGRNTAPGDWVRPRLRPAETMATARKNFRRMMRYIKGRDDIEITTYRALLPVYGKQQERIDAGEIGAAAAGALGTRRLAPTDTLSPAEIMAALAGSLAEYRRTKALPRVLAAKHPLGPSEMPVERPEIARVTLKDVYRLAAEALEAMDKTGALPVSLGVGGARIGTGSLLALFSAVYLDAAADRLRPEYDVPAFEPYPRTNEAGIVKQIEGYKSWPVHRPDLDVSRIVEFTRLQLWTLKPATRS